MKIKHAKILQNIKLVKDGDSYDVGCDDGYEVAKSLARKDGYMGQGKLKKFQVQNSNGRNVFIAEKMNYKHLVCKEGKQGIRENVHLCTYQFC